MDKLLHNVFVTFILSINLHLQPFVKVLRSLENVHISSINFNVFYMDSTDKCVLQQHIVLLYLLLHIYALCCVVLSHKIPIKCIKYKFILHIIFICRVLSLFGVHSVVLEPDVGMPEKDAHRFFKQLIAAVVSKFRL